MSEAGKQYAHYHHHSKLKPYVYTALPGAYEESLVLELPAGTYKSDWVSPADGSVISSETFTHAGGKRSVKTPKHAVDMALRIKAS